MMLLPKLFVLTRATHFFKISVINDSNVRKLVYVFVRRFVKVAPPRGLAQMETPEMTTYAASDDKRTEFRFHINCLPDFLKHLEFHGIKKGTYIENELPLIPPDVVEIKTRPEWVLRPEDQAICSEYIKENNEWRSKFVGMQTGDGKTVTSLSSITGRFIIIIKPMYIGKWTKDIAEILDINTKEEAIAVQGSEDLKALLMLAATPGGLDNIKVIIISNKTIQMYYDLYEKLGSGILNEGYMCVPEELFNHCRVSTRLIDEAHKDFHLNFKVDLYSNVAKSISLSATMLHDDPFIEGMQKLQFPPESRYKGVVLKKYAHSFGVSYHLAYNRKVKTSEFGQSTYSHNAFEKSILKDEAFFQSYAAMVKDWLEEGYISKKLPGERAIVFASTKEMCTKLTAYLQAEYPDLTVTRYVQGDPYKSNYLESDIRVTTVLSGGTAHDVKNLIAAFLTIALKSLQANIQVLGRLRKIQDKIVRFYFFTCMDIGKHITYHEEKEKLMRERAATYVYKQYQRRI